MLDAYYAFRALKGLDEGCKAYVKRFADGGAKTQPPAVSEYTLYDAITKGLQEQSRQAVTKLLASEKPLDIINGHMTRHLTLWVTALKRKACSCPSC